MILLSPAKSLDYKQSIPFKPFVSQPIFIKETEKLVKKLKKFSSKKLEKLFHVSPEIADLNYYRFQDWEQPIEEKETIKPCIEVFNGEAYKGLNPFTFNEDELIYAQEHLRILSGLYGVLKPLDLMYPYRLEMGTKWEIDTKNKNLYAFWTEKITKQLKSEKPAFIINVASNEYFKAIDFKKLGIKTIVPVFKDFKNGEYKVIMMYAKHARGAMARFCIQNKISDVEQIKLFNSDGYSYNDLLSNENEWVFTRS
jgi:cytoplasmic iron level regulating protein YaaA (DUF328/UPF0246 family)